MREQVQKIIRTPPEAAVVPGLDNRIEPLAQVRDSGLGEFRAAQFLGDLGDLPCGHTIDHHLQ